MSERVVKHSFDLVFGVHLILPSTNHPCQKEEEEKKQHLRNSQISKALFQIRKIKHFRQQPPFTLPSDSSNSHFWKCRVLIRGLSRPLNPVILTPCGRQHDIPDLRGPLETHFSLLSFHPRLHPPSLPPALLHSSALGSGSRRKRWKVREEEGDWDRGGLCRDNTWISTLIARTFYLSHKQAITRKQLKQEGKQLDTWFRVVLKLNLIDQNSILPKRLCSILLKLNFVSS